MKYTGTGFGRLNVTIVLLLKSRTKKESEHLTRQMACPVTNTALDIARLRNVQDGATHLTELDVIHTGIALFKVFDKLRHPF